ncbi:helix-turn-helix transcriptional regulator [Kineosporia sp. R_H_3]|uniref:ArsR/SmtB family transcription factor n=1 Tax=Kineosporia sp. R_H_3 TaxID=1961848 RepID=UPI000B4B4A2B|nr:metalloregulator ArsR/SmtB family transcription factor [Kineosporia sp. R_H_3]
MRDGPAQDDVSDDVLDGVLVALANPHRRDIVYLVGLQPRAVSELARHRGLSLPAIHKHISILVDAGLVVRHKRGRTTYLTLNRRPLAQLQDWVGQFHTYWGADRATYDNYARHLGIDAPDPDPDPGGDAGAGTDTPSGSQP